MSWEGYQRVPVERMGSLVTNFASEKLPSGVSPNLRNMKFTRNSVKTRDGLQKQFSLPDDDAPVRGMGVLIRTGLTPTYIPTLFDAEGQLSIESPVGAGATTAIASPLVILPSNAYMEMASTFQRAYMAFGDLKTGIGEPCTFDGTNVDPCSNRPMGERWAAATLYRVGDMVSPVTPNGHLYRCIVGGIAGALEPAWPLADAGTVVDGQVTWKEYTLWAGQYLPAPNQPVLTRSPGAGGFAAGRDVYIAITFLNGNGETIGSVVSKLVNTVLNDRVIVTAPTVLSALSGLAAPYAATGYRVYEADVATGAAAPASTLYLLSGATVALGVNANVDGAGIGAAIPTNNAARIVNVGNLCSGIRYVAALMVNRNGDIGGATVAAVIQVNVPVAGFQLFVGNIPAGPTNIAQRVVAVTQALQASTGPFVFLPQAGSVSGISYTSTVVADNVTTTSYFNFTDPALAQASDVTNNFRKIKLPPQAHVVYNRKTHSLFWFGEQGQPTLVRVSQADQPETYYGDNGYFYVSRDDGERVITSREYNSETWIWKDRSLYVVAPNTQQPGTWAITPRWTGKYGAAGPRAVDAGTTFAGFACRSGAYIMQASAEPILVSDEFQDQWEQINWAYGYKIVVHIDEETKEMRVSVPMGGATENNKTFTMNFARGLEHPIHFSSFSGKEGALPISRKWSRDDFGGSSIMRMERPISGASDITDSSFLQSQVLVASNGDGTVSAIVPDVHNDNGNGIDSYYETASLGQEGNVVRFGGFTLSATGLGKLFLSLIPYRGEPKALNPFTLDPSRNGFYRRQARATGRQFGVGFGNGGVVDTWFEIFETDLYLAPVWPSETKKG